MTKFIKYGQVCFITCSKQVRQTMIGKVSQVPGIIKQGLMWLVIVLYGLL